MYQEMLAVVVTVNECWEHGEHEGLCLLYFQSPLWELCKVELGDARLGAGCWLPLSCVPGNHCPRTAALVLRGKPAAATGRREKALLCHD